MEPLEIIKRPAAYVSGYENIPQQAQKRANRFKQRMDYFRNPYEK